MTEKTEISFYDTTYTDVILLRERLSMAFGSLGF